MARTPARQALDEAIRLGLSPVLGGLGYRSHHPLEAAACSLLLGDEAAARRIVERVAREAPQATAVLDWGRRRGLLP